MNRFWKWTRNEVLEEGKPAERTLSFEGVISSESWFDDDITPASFREELMQDDGPITIAVNSPGGDCVAASMIYTMLKEYPGKITVRIEGIAASAASVVSMAGDVIQMSPTSLLMIHNPSTIAIGESSDMMKAVRLLDETKESIINAYTIKTGLSRAKLSHMMDDETWLNAVKAKELGFCDEILYTEDEQSAEEDAPLPFIFSQRHANLLLMNLVKEKRHGEEEKEPPQAADAVPPPQTHVEEESAAPAPAGEGDASAQAPASADDGAARAAETQAESTAASAAEAQAAPVKTRADTAQAAPVKTRADTAQAAPAKARADTAQAPRYKAADLMKRLSLLQ